MLPQPATSTRRGLAIGILLTTKLSWRTAAAGWAAARDEHPASCRQPRENVQPAGLVRGIPPKRPPAGLSLDEGEQIGAQLLLVGIGDAVRRARIDLQRRVLHQLGPG